MKNLFCYTLEKGKETEIDDGYVQFSEQFVNEFLHKQDNNKWQNIKSNIKIKFSELSNEMNSNEMNSNEMTFNDFITKMKNYSEDFNNIERVSKPVIFDSLYFGPIHNKPNFQIIEQFKTKITNDFIFEFKISSKLFEYFNYDSNSNFKLIENIKINNKYRIDFNNNEKWDDKYFTLNGGHCFQIDEGMKNKDLTKEDIKNDSYEKVDITYELCESIVNVFNEIVEIYYENNEECETELTKKIYKMNL
jgi:hypothetical protein